MISRSVLSLAMVVAAISALVLPENAKAARLNQTEYSFTASNGMSGTVTYPCSGGVVYWWDDGVVRTRQQSQQLLADTVVTMTAISGETYSCGSPAPTYTCAKEFDWNNVPTTWDEAVEACSPWYFDN